MSKKANELLFEVVKSGKLVDVKKALKQGAKINRISKWDGTALHIAASNGFIDIIEFLLDEKADSTILAIADFTPLHLAARDGQIEAVKLLLKKGGPYKDSILSDINSIVSMSGRYPIIADLIRKKRVELIKPSTDDCNRKDAKLFKAVYAGDIEAITKTLESGANVNAHESRGMSVLRWAVRRNHHQIVKFLLEQGAEINAVSNVGWTALMEAAMNGLTPIVKLLLDKDAEVNITTTVNGTAIYFAANDGYEDIVKLLLEHNADPTIEVEISTMHDDYTKPAIQAAYENGHSEIVKLLEKYFEKK